MYYEVLSFWFEQLEPKQWWMKDEALDRLILEKFSDVHAKATRCELFSWRNEPQGRLAEILVLDQFSRNMFRDTALSFACDSIALALAQEAVSSGADLELTQPMRNFVYMPYMHSESLVIHDVAMELFRDNGTVEAFEYEIKHRDILLKFGRYPHRNKALGRISTTAEVEFLKKPGSGF